MKKLIHTIKTNADILIVLTLGLILRLKIILRDDLWYDEAFTGYLMKIPYKLFVQTIKADAHPPLYLYLTKAWTILLGVNDFTLRLLPLIFGVLTILVVYFLAKKLFGKETASFAALLVTVSPFLIGYSTEARSYSLYGLLAVLSFYLLTTKRTNLFLLIFVLFVNTHYMALLFVPIIFLYYIYLMYTKTLSWKKELPKLVICGLVVFIIYNTLTGRENADLNLEWVRAPGIINIPRSIAAYLYGVKTKLGGADELNNIKLFVSSLWLGEFFFGVYLIFSSLLIYKKIATPKPKDRNTLLQFTFVNLMFLVPQIILILYSKKAELNLYVERYLFPSSIFFLISLAAVLSKLLRFETAAVIVIVYTFTLTKIQPPNYYTGMKLLSQTYAKFENEIVFTSPTDFLVGRYYFSLHNTSHKTRLYDPQKPNLTYWWWPLTNETHKPKNLGTAVIISPEDSRMTEEFKKVDEHKGFGNYKVFIKN